MNTLTSTCSLRHLGVVSGIALLVGATALYAADPSVALSPMGDAQLSLESDGATIKADDGYITVSFRRLSYPESELGNVSATVETSQGAFVGDYLANGIRGLKFDLMQSGTPTVMVELRTASGRTWYNRDLVTMADAGEWTENNVAFDLVAGWQRDDGKSIPENWDEALSSVTAIGLRIRRRSSHAQYATVNAFQLLLADNTLTPQAVLVNRLYERFGVDSVEALSEAQLREDSDGNGIADWQEIMITQTNPFDANDGLLVKVSRTANGENEIAWTGVKGGRYRVQVASHPAGPWVDEVVGIVQASVNGRVARVDPESNAGGMRFYRVVQLVD